MSLTADIATRIEAQVPILAGHVMTAAELGALMQREVRLAFSPSAWVVPGEIVAKGGQEVVGVNRQTIMRHASVVLAVRTVSGTGARELPDIEALIDAVALALIGFEPPSIAASARGVLAMVRCDLVAIRSGVIVYELVFAVEDEWRPT